MLVIDDVKSKGKLMVLYIRDEKTGIKFNLEIDKNVDDTMVWNHIFCVFNEKLRDLIEEKPSPELEKKWKGKKKGV